jgi:hypothetical protein
MCAGSLAAIGIVLALPDFKPAVKAFEVEALERWRASGSFSPLRDVRASQKSPSAGQKTT